MEPSFKPGDTVWILWQKLLDVKNAVCPFCGGDCYVYADGKNGETKQLNCPTCKGEGEIRISSRYQRVVEKVILDRVQLALDIPSAYYAGTRWLYNAPDKGIDRIFGTEAEAQADADKWNAEQKES